MKYLKLFEDFDFDDEDEEEDDVYTDNTFLELAQTLLDNFYHHMNDNSYMYYDYDNYEDVNFDGFVMPEHVIKETADELERAYEEGNITPDEEGRLYDIDLMDDFTHLYYSELERWIAHNKQSSSKQTWI